MKRICYLILTSLIFFVESFVLAKAPNLLTYQGRLTESGQPVTDVRNIDIKLCDALTGGNCYSDGAQNVQIFNGLFRTTFTVPSQVAPETGEWYLEIVVEGAALSPREKFTSSLYALHSSTASYANNLSAVSGSDGVFVSTSLFVTDGNVGIGTTSPGAKLDVQGGDINTSSKVKEDGNVLIPTGDVMFFNLGSCPAGWSELISARGRYLVGLPSAGTLGGTQGTALSNLEDRPVGQHSHGITDPGHSHGILFGPNGADYATLDGESSASYANTTVETTNITINDAGSVAGTNAPYIQLLVCQKD